MDAPFEYVFPAIRGVQALREFYVSMCPLRLISKLFLFNEEELVPELRAQRTLNKSRIPEITQYILHHRDSYTFSAITASIDADVRFEPFGLNGENKRVGLLHIPMSAKFIINDGQHRRRAIELALLENPDLADESIAVVFFMDVGLERCQQMFADLNRYAIRPSKSIGVLYDHRDDMARLTKYIVMKSPFFRGLVDMERSTLSLRSRKLFTLSSIYAATTALLVNVTEGSLEEQTHTVVNFWEELSRLFPEWHLVQAHKMSAGDVRKDFIHSHGVALQAMGRAGNTILRKATRNWRRSLKHLNSIDWSRSNTTLWEGRALSGGKVSKAGHNITLTTNVIKRYLNLELTPEEQRIENAFLKGEYAKQ